MIHIFRSHVPFDIYRLMVREYFDCRSILKRMTEGKAQFSALRRDEEVTDLMLALAVFYRHVITQFEGAEMVMTRMRASNISVVRMGETKLDAASVDAMHIAVRQFYGLISQYLVPVEIFREHDLREFARALTTYLKAQE